MSVDNKHLAAVLLGAAAAFGAYKYTHMSDEEKQQLTNNIKDKFHKLKAEAENSADTAKNYFSDLKDKAGSLLKEHFPQAEKYFDEFFGGENKENTATAQADTTPANPA